MCNHPNEGPEEVSRGKKLMQPHPIVPRLGNTASATVTTMNTSSSGPTRQAASLKWSRFRKAKPVITSRPGTNMIPAQISVDGRKLRAWSEAMNSSSLKSLSRPETRKTAAKEKGAQNFRNDSNLGILWRFLICDFESTSRPFLKARRINENIRIMIGDKLGSDQSG